MLRLGHGQGDRADRHPVAVLKLVEQLRDQRNSQAGLRDPLGIGKDFMRRAFLPHASPRENINAVGQDGQQIHAVGGDDQRDLLPAIELDEQIDHLRFARRVEARGRLVQQQNAGLHGQHAGQADAFLLAVAEMVDRTLAQRQGIDRGQRLLDALGHLGLGKPLVPRTEGHVLFHRGREKLVGRILENHAHAAVQFVCRRLRTSSAPRSTSPRSGWSRRMSTFKRVVLPEPLAPMTATISPSMRGRKGPRAPGFRRDRQTRRRGLRWLWGR